ARGAPLRACSPARENAFVVPRAGGAQARDPRRIIGIYTLTKEDVVSGTRFPDAVVVSGFPADLHSPDGKGMETHITKTHQVPYRCLVPREVNGLLVAGRCVSATREALAAIRQTAPALAMGQAAGPAAALSVLTQSTPRGLSVDLLRSELRKANAIVDS